MELSSRYESRQSKLLSCSSGGRVTFPLKYNLATKVQKRLQATRFLLCATRPDKITVVEVGENIRLQIDEEERARQEPGESA